MIPKIIHYCWFGKKPLPESAKKCKESWRVFCPEYEIKEWNESNFDLNCCDYVREAYVAKKWAFVSDYARFWILYKYGGLYFDTDVEIIRSFDEIVKKGPYMGCEKTMVAPGLGIAAVPGLSIYKEILDDYENLHFLRPDGSINGITVVHHATDILKKHGFVENGSIQYIDGIYIYPSDFFCPMDYLTGNLVITENTFSIHHYAATWFEPEQLRFHELRKKILKLFGMRLGGVIVIPIKYIYKFKLKVRQMGGGVPVLHHALKKIIG